MTRPFRFKEFEISQENTPMKVGTDGVLLGAWVSVSHSKNALDIGTGTGLIALMLAQRNPDIQITAIEPNELALNDARINFENSEWNDRIQLIDSSLDNFEPASKFDLIISNPPYFQRDLLSPNEGRSMARHATDFDHIAFAKASEFLEKDGVIAGIYPVAIFKEFDSHARTLGLLPGRVCEVQPTPSKAPHRVLFEYSFAEVENCIFSSLIIEENGRHKYSKKYIDLTREFYLDL